MYENVLKETGPLFQVAVMVMLAVLLAMIIDLGAGLYKAKQRGELRTSEALRRTLSKFISYEGGLMIATIADLFIHLSKFYQLVGMGALIGVPIVSILVGLFLLVVEFMSVREKADAKTKKQQEQAAGLLMKLVSKEDLAEFFKWIAEKNHAAGGGEGDEDQ